MTVSAVKAFPPPPVRGKVPCSSYLVKSLCETCAWHEIACGSGDISSVPARVPIEGKCEWYERIKPSMWKIPREAK